MSRQIPKENICYPTGLKMCPLAFIPYQHSYLPSSALFLPPFFPAFRSFPPFLPSFHSCLPAIPALLPKTRSQAFQTLHQSKSPRAQITPLCPQIGHLRPQIRPLGLQIRSLRPYICPVWNHRSLLPFSSYPHLHLLKALGTAGHVTLLRLLLYYSGFQEEKGR